VQINETLETEEGTVQFKGEISGKELDLVIQTGLLTLMQRGVITFQTYKLNPELTSPILQRLGIT
jgi:hypothetical protein